MKLTLKKGIALVLALTFAISLFSGLMVFGAGGTLLSTDSATFGAVYSSTSAKPGQTFNVTVSCDAISPHIVQSYTENTGGNLGLGGLVTVFFQFEYNANALEYVSTAAPSSNLAVGLEAEGKDYGTPTSTSGVLSYNLKTVANGSDTTNALLGTGNIFIVTFKVLDTASVGTSNIKFWTGSATTQKNPVTKNVKTLTTANTIYTPTNTTFTVASDAPVISLNTYNGTTPTNQSIDVTATTDKGTFDDNGLTTLTHTFTANDTFTFNATNTVSGTPYKTAKDVTISNIDKTKPTITGVTDGSIYKADQTITFGDNVAGSTAKLDNVDFTSGSTVGEGVHTLVATDTASNTTTISFTIDKTAPTVSGVEDGKTYGADKIITFTDNIGIASAKLDTADITSPKTVTAEKTYTLVVTDTAGNVTTISFTINKQVPIVTGVTEGSVYNTDKTITFDKGTATLDGITFANGSTVSAEGSHTLIVTDSVTSLSTTVNFTIDKTAPTATGVTNNGIYNSDKAISFTEGTGKLDGNSYLSGATISAEGSHTFELTDAVGNKTTLTFTIDKTAPTATGVTNNGIYNSDKAISFTEGTGKLDGNSYSSGTTISAEGSHTFELTDTAGNKTTLTFIIDKTAPTATGVTNNSIYNSDKAISFTEGTGKLDGNSYSSGTTISAEGSHTFELTDTAGNKTTLTFTIDKTGPVITAKDASNNSIADNALVPVYVTVKITTNEGSFTAKKNTDDYTVPANATFTEAGTYVITATDAVGNFSTFTFTLIPTADAGTLTDSATNTTITYDANQLPEEVVLKVTKEENTSITGATKTAIEIDGVIAAVYDISFLMDNVKVQPNGTVKVSLPIPADKLNSTIKVKHIKADGTVEDVTFTVVNGFAVFESASFSNYVIVEKIVSSSTSSTGNTANTGDNFILYFALALIALISVFVLRRRFAKN